MIDELIKTMIEHNKIVSVCSFSDCRKVHVDKNWYVTNYNNNYKNYSHGVCPDCKIKYYSQYLKK